MALQDLEVAKANRKRRAELLREQRTVKRARDVEAEGEDLPRSSAPGPAPSLSADATERAREIAEGYIAVEDSSEARRKARMLRNRRSAEMSRKRKRDKLQQLQQQVEALAQQNRLLQQQMKQRDQQIGMLSDLLAQATKANIGRTPEPVLAPSRPRALNVQSLLYPNQTDLDMFDQPDLEPAAMLRNFTYNHHSAKSE
jgi:hypothetical protein